MMTEQGPQSGRLSPIRGGRPAVRALGGDANAGIGFTELNVCSEFPARAWIVEEMENRHCEEEARQDER
jgi:hypothetical protein